MPICNITITAIKPHRLPFPDSNDVSLGIELKRKHLDLEWPQDDTAKYFGVLKDSYQNWEWNQYLPHIKNRKKIVSFLGFNFWDDGTELLSNKVLLYRIEYGLTMSELAQKINVSVRTVERIENNEIHISEKMNKKVEEHINH
ncbi:helix-turn-helix transcriptional regulator [Flavivirga aquimarina]|uniref:Helix-turn-helix transcriptional regulator n=1 Tax=Flavivirga aquimarina TaxID=2027862 RepID=A0ABT8WFU2_9FLAO|nr:helix-turn-helix transcriptional regulator [Flavivirga aquimarina]MDO5972015.1 helix-turn-helix transcriptional regulator [Flavivirga aquimarina]